MGKVLDGKVLAEKIKQRLATEIAPLAVKPGLATVIVDFDPASKVYVGAKVRACQAVGMYSEKVELPADVTEAEYLAEIERLNHDPRIHGILAQLPVSPQINESAILGAIDPAKDVDGFHPINMGCLLGHRRGEIEDLLVPCTPRGIMRLLAETGVDLKGKHAVVIGRSNMVGKPMALLLTYADATVTLCHRATTNLSELVRSADVVVAAVGQIGLITAEMVKPGAVVIDVGVNRNAEGKIVGDVDFDAVLEVADWVTPMPGGTGPMTIACLLENTLLAYRQQLG